MHAFLILYLTVTGIGAFIAMTMPGLVIAGFYLLILPGLILSLMPTAFLYGAAFALFWWPLRSIVGEWTAVPIALAGGFALLWLVPTAANAIIDLRVAADRAGEKKASTPIPISGVVRIESTQWTGVPKDSAEGRAHFAAARAARVAGYKRHPVACDALCAAALFTRGVEAVILAPMRFDPDEGLRPEPENAPAQFRIDRSGRCRESVDVGEPGGDGLGIWDKGDALRAEWRTRISAGECIVRERPTREPDFTIAVTKKFHPGRIKDPRFALVDRSRRTTRLAISNRQGRIFQQTMVETSRLARPLRIDGMGGHDSFGFGWGFESLGNGREIGFFEPLKLLARLTPLNLKARPGEAVRGARRQLMALLDDPSRPASDPGFNLAGIVLEDMADNGLKEGDAEFVERIVGDPRTRRLNGIWNVIPKLGDDSARLREPIVNRLLRGEPIGGEGSSNLGAALAKLPVDLFAKPTPDELALLTHPERRNHAEGLIRRQSDRGVEAVPMLLDMIEDIVRRRNAAGKRAGAALGSDAFVAAKHALSVLGPSAAFARPRLEALLEAQQDVQGRVKTWHWEVTLVRMGRMPESFEKPSWRGGSEADYHRSLRRDVEELERDLAKAARAANAS